MNNEGSGFIILLILLYFTPILVANHRHHKNQAGIAVLNIFLGWTIIGWVGALIWAVSN